LIAKTARASGRAWSDAPSGVRTNRQVDPTDFATEPSNHEVVTPDIEESLYDG
jgi:hypothetical protein